MDIYREDIKKKLLPLSEKARVLFSVLICERLYPNYLAFQKNTGWGNHEKLREGIALLRQYLINVDLFEEDEIKNLIEDIDLITPHTEEFSGIITSFALDACTAISGTLNFLLDKNIENVVDVATYARDTVNMYIQEKEDLNSNDPKLEEKISQDPFMHKEMSRQQELLKKLTVIKLDPLTDKIIESLKDPDPIIDLTMLSIS